MTEVEDWIRRAFETGEMPECRHHLCECVAIYTINGPDPEYPVVGQIRDRESGKTWPVSWRADGRALRDGDNGFNLLPPLHPPRKPRESREDEPFPNYGHGPASPSLGVASGAMAPVRGGPGGSGSPPVLATPATGDPSPASQQSDTPGTDPRRLTEAENALDLLPPPPKPREWWAVMTDTSSWLFHWKESAEICAKRHHGNTIVRVREVVEGD